MASFEAAGALRKRDPNGPITIVGDEPHPPYDRPPLSEQFLRAEMSREELFLKPPTHYAEHKIDLFLGVAVDRLDPNAAVRCSG